MKKIYILSLLILAIVKVGIAQTPQNTLINWDMSQWQPGFLGYENPKGWVSGNLVGLDTVAKKVSGIGSGFAALLTTRNIPGLSTQTNGQIPDINGIMLTGTVLPVFPPKLKTGFPYADRPEYLEFSSKYQPVGNDTAFVLVLLYKRNSGAANIDTIATAYYQEYTASTEYAHHILPLNYRQPLIPANPATDSLLVVVSSSSLFAPQIGSKFYFTAFDDNWTGISKKFNNSSDFISPNPATTHFTWNNLSKGVSRVELYDISGKLVFTENIQKDIVSISTAQLKNGVYFAKAYTLNSEQVSLKKVIVSK
jgi:hypothetical protein